LFPTPPPRGRLIDRAEVCDLLSVEIALSGGFDGEIRSGVVVNPGLKSGKGSVEPEEANGEAHDDENGSIAGQGHLSGLHVLFVHVAAVATTTRVVAGFFLNANHQFRFIVHVSILPVRG